ncbi:MAG: LPS-assembly protein LptD [Neisseria sp.]|uniref:LPS-assembly protein LptD n=1 Tax=Neisseria sp. TaxID=192066 RepID=UPI0026DC5435|nr:LPS-assembly protein LptD [Neisseria sp.]MDO4248393.1 LPS-assembly protein LptD [Neisseria sp.]
MARLFRLKPVVWGLGIAFGAQAAYADDLSLGSTCLNCNPAELSAAAASAPTVETSGEAALPTDYTRITADEVGGQSKVSVRAEGNVIIERNSQVLNAQWVDYNQQTETVTAGDSFVLYDNGSVVTGGKLEYKLSDSTGSGENLRLETEHEGRRLQAVSAQGQLQGKNRYHLQDTKFNTCQRGDASWYIQADSIEADYEQGVGVAKNAKLVFGGVPVLYTPWADFPLNGNRKSGLLVPTVGLGSDGLELDLPYYLNLAPNYDATITPGVIGSRGARIGGQFRYLQPKYAGQVEGTWMPDDRKSEHNNRYQFKLNHNQQFTSKLSGGIDYNRVSDNDYYRDFYGQDDIAANVNLNRQVWLNYNDTLWGGALNGHFTVQKYQTLANIYGYKDEPYAILPRLQGTWNKNIGNAQVDLFGQFTRFDHDSKQSGNRAVFYPSVRWNLHNEWGFISPKLGVHYTFYDLDDFENNPGRSVSRTLPIFNIDAGMTFERQTRLFGHDFVQTLEPRLFYNYIPTKSQNDLPNFDSSENSFSYEQLFRENLYSGNDRINSANSLTAALQTRYLDDKTGAERLRAGIGQKYYFTTDNVLLDGSVSRYQRNRSDWIAFGQGQISESVSAHAIVHYNQNLRRWENLDTGLLYNPEPGKALSVRYKYGRNEPIYLQDDGNYYYDKLKQIDIGAQWPITRQLSAVARFNYDLDVKKPLEQLVGLEYRSGCGCWSASVVGQRYVNSLNSYKNGVFFNLQLKDLSNIGNNPSEKLRLVVPGYSPTHEVMKK